MNLERLVQPPDTRQQTLRIFASAGEPSGDSHAAAVIRRLRPPRVSVRCRAIGGTAMAEAGADLVASLDRLSVVGLTEGLIKVPAHLERLMRVRRLLADGCDLVLLVDYPGFNLRIAAAAARGRVPVLYYIAPQLWAWGAARARRLRETVRHLAVILPFEPEFFGRLGISSTFVGHPLLDDPTPPPRETARRRLDISSRRPAVALCPGSRSSEVARHWPLFLAAARWMRLAVPELTIRVAAVSGHRYPGGDDFELIWDDAVTVLSAADAALVKSGTVTLQAALCGTPMVIAYQMHPLTYAIARRVVKTRHVGLVNLIANREIAPELIQGAATPQQLAIAGLALLDAGGSGAQRQRDAFEEIRSRLGRPGVAERVANLVLEMAAT